MADNSYKGQYTPTALPSAEWKDAQASVKLLAFVIAGLVLGLLSALVAFLNGAGLLVVLLAYSVGGSSGFLITTFLHNRAIIWSRNQGRDYNTNCNPEGK